MEFRFDYGTVQASQPQAAAAPLWAAIDGRVSPLADDEMVFFDPITGRSHVMTQQVLQALDLCRAFRPLSEHVEAVAAQLPGLQGKQTAVKPVLESLQTRGLMVSDDAWLKRMSLSGKNNLTLPTQAPVSGLFVRACNRPAQLAALLQSLRGRESELRAAQRLIVIDDSTSDAAVATHAQHLTEFAVDWPGPVHHVTPTLWRGMVDELASELPELADALRGVLLTGDNAKGSGGSGRNLATLLAAGTRYLILDDDNLFPLTAMPESQLALDLRPGASKVLTYSDHAAALSAGEENRGAVDWHLSACGRSFGMLVADGELLGLGVTQLRGFEPSRAPALTAEARVVLTVNGHRGGSCSASPYWLLSLDARQRAGLCASEADYLANRGDASVCAGFGSAFFARSALISPFAVDNSQMMPCTSAHSRCEDMVYNSLVSVGDGGSLQLHTPWVAGHRPEQGRNRQAQLDAARVVPMGLCISELIGSVSLDVKSEHPAARYAAIAHRLQDLAGGSNEAVQGYLREYLVYDRAQLVRQLQEVLPGAEGAPPSFIADIRRQIEYNARAIVERGLPRFSDTPKNASADECALAFREQVNDLSGGLLAWPAAWEVALQRRETWLERARLRP